MRLRDRAQAWPVSPLALFAVVIAAVAFVGVYEVGNHQLGHIPPVASVRLSERTGVTLRPARGPVVLEQAEASVLARLVNHLPGIPNGKFNCPNSDGSTFTLDFTSTTGRHARVVADETGCAFVSFGSGGHGGRWDRDGALNARVIRDIGPPPSATR